MKFKHDICIIGGAGHVGLPLGLLFASKKKNVILYDINKSLVKKINKGKMPFIEIGAQKLLTKFKSKILATNDKRYIQSSKYIIICIGTPINKNLKPDLKNFLALFKSLAKIVKKEQIIIIRSSVYPNVCKKINLLFKKRINLAYCPERIVQGLAVAELPKLPQIVSSFSKKAEKSAAKLFKIICKKIIVTSVLEAELIKLYSNAWRYVNFSISNQFYMICENLNINFNKIRKNMIEGYNRNKGIPLAGFAAGPCLLKDTMQLSAFVNNKFSLGKNAMFVNEGMPLFLIKKLKEKYKLKNKKVGVLGLAFKADIDDIRDSLSFKLIDLLKKNKAKVFLSDEYYSHPDGIKKESLIKKSDIIIIAVPHTAYKKIKFPKNKIIVDSWGIVEKK